MKKLVTVLLIIAIAAAIGIGSMFFSQPLGAQQFIIITDNLEANENKKALAQQLKSLIEQKHKKVTARIVDINEFDLPLVEAALSPAQEPIKNPAVEKWAATIAPASALIFIVPNYHNGIPGRIKNAIDLIWIPWHNKPVGLVAYSPSGMQGSDLIHAMFETFDEIKSDPVKTVVYLPSVKSSLAEGKVTDSIVKSQMSSMIDELYESSRQSKVFKRFFRACVDKIMRTLLKFTVKPRSKE